MDIKQIKVNDYQEIKALLAKYAEEGPAFNDAIEALQVPLQGVLLYKKGLLKGFCTYWISRGEMTIQWIFSIEENCGYGNLMLRTMLNQGIDLNITKVKVVVSNDNLRALRFFQRMGFSMVKIHKHAMTKKRKKHPQMALYNDFIRIEHEIELEQVFNQGVR